MFIGRIVSQKEILESLVYIHTDGFRCKVKPEDIDYTIGKKIGELKFKRLDGLFYIRKLNEMYYYNDKKEWEIYQKEREYIKEA